jgi:hypothetical protein
MECFGGDLTWDNDCFLLLLQAPTELRAFGWLVSSIEARKIKALVSMMTRFIAWVMWCQNETLTIHTLTRHREIAVKVLGEVRRGTFDGLLGNPQEGFTRIRVLLLLNTLSQEVSNDRSLGLSLPFSLDLDLGSEVMRR